MSNSNKNESSIIVENLTKTFGKFKAVNDISFEVKKGEIFGFLGSNGAGKTTALKILCGLLKPTSGTALVAGHDVIKESEKVKRKIGYMSQKFSLYDDLTVNENIEFFAGIYGLNKKDIKLKTDELLEKLNMSSIKNEIISSLPQGWKQKLAFSTAVIHMPEIVFLDEPTGGVDPLTRRNFWELIYEFAAQNLTVFVTTHYMDEAEYCSRISMMTEGRIAALGNPNELKKLFNAKDMNDVFIKISEGKKN